MHGFLLATTFTLLAPSLALKQTTSANNHDTSFRGWTSFPLQAYGLGNKYGNNWFNEDNMWKQAQALKSLGSGYDYFMFDSGWSADVGDANGRITYNKDKFPNFLDLVKRIKGLGLKVGIYIIPGAFTEDIKANKPINASNFTMGQINAPCTDNSQFPCGSFRTNLGWANDSQRKASQAWVKSVVDQFASWGVDLIKFDFLSPFDGGGSWGSQKDNFDDVKAYHNAISTSSNKQIWLLESFNLDQTPSSLNIWRETGDSYRIASDINNSPGADGKTTLVSWFAVQRTADAYRKYITTQKGREGGILKGWSDLDSMMIGNEGELNALSSDQRRTYFSIWALAGVPIYLGDDLTILSNNFKTMLTNSEILSIHDNWTGKVAPATYIAPDKSQSPSQLQIWQAGTFGDKQETVVMVANMGCKDDDKFEVPWECKQKDGGLAASVDLSVLGLSGEFCVRDVWAGKDLGKESKTLGNNLKLGPGAGVVWKLSPSKNGCEGGN